MIPLIIEKLYAWIADDEDGSQGLIAWTDSDGMTFPLVGADMARIESFRDFATQLAHEYHKRISLVEFSTKTVLEVINSH